VAHGDTNTGGGDVLDQLEGMGQLRGHGHQANVTSCCLLEAIEELDAGLTDADVGMYSSLDLGDEGAFQMDSDGKGGGKGSIVAMGALDRVGKILQRPQGEIDGCGHGGGEIMSHSAAGEKPSDLMLSPQDWRP
jgi:hypothetical protein